MTIRIINFARDKSAGGKFVVLAQKEDPEKGILLVSDFSLDSQHAGIVRRWEKTGRRDASDAGFRPVGGGWWKFTGPSSLELSGFSAAYGRFDPVWLREHLRPGEMFGESELAIR